MSIVLVVVSASQSLLNVEQKAWLISVSHGSPQNASLPASSPGALATLRNRTFSKLLVFEKFHHFYNQAVDVVYNARFDRSKVVSYDDVGDSLFWTSHYATAIAHYYNVTGGDRESFHKIKDYIDTVDLLSGELTTKVGYLARFAGLTSDPYYEKYIGPSSSSSHVGAAPYINLTWLGKESRDQYLGAAFGLASVRALVQEFSSNVSAEEIRSLQQSVSLLVERIVDRLRLDTWFIDPPKGIKDLPVNPTPFFICTWARLAINVNPTKYAKLNLVNSIWFKVSKTTKTWNPTSMFKSSYFSNNLNVISLYTYYLMEDTDSSKKNDVLDALKNLAVGEGSKHLQATFSCYYLAAAKNKDPVASGILVGSLLDFPEKWDKAVNNTDNPLYKPHHDAENSGIAMLPSDRKFDTYMWQRTPTTLAGGSNSTTEYQNIDAFLPYIVGMYAGVF